MTPSPVLRPALRQRYEQLSTDRSPYLSRARDASKYTIPALLPAEGATGSTKLKVTYSSFGARCVNSLASKLNLALFPPRAPFFRLSLSQEAMNEIGGDDVRTQVEEALSNYEQGLVDLIEQTNARPQGKEVARHLIVAGNVLIFIRRDGGLKVHALHSYVTKRDPAGKPLEVILHERLSATEVSDPELREAAKAARVKTGKSAPTDDTLDLYTGVFFEDGQYITYQELEGVRVKGSDGSWPEDQCPYKPLRWTSVTGEDYGRGMVEEYLGDLISLEGLTAALVKGSAALAKLIFLRNPNGATKASALTKAETGSVIDGNEQDVTVLQAQKQADFTVTRQMVQDLRGELAYAFLLHNAIQRDAERVTAEEIRFMANELDSTLGGIYTTLSVEFQLPYINRIMVGAGTTGALPMLPAKALKPVITTGIEALGRGAELENLKAFVADVVSLGGPEALNTDLNFDDLLKRLATARGIRTRGLVKTPEEKAAAQQAAQQQSMLETLGPNAVNQLGGMVQTSMKGQQ